MVRFYDFSWYELDMTQSAPIFLFLEQHQPLFRVGFPSYLLLLALYPVVFERWIIGRISACDLGEACNRGFIGLDQFGLPFLERPVAVTPEVASFHPFTAFVRVSAFGPDPQHLPLGMTHFLEDIFGCTVSVVIRPSPYDWVECPYNFHMCVYTQ
jgi:hypothetical protein